jgi:hypothetical protein
MIEGVVRHETSMEIDANMTDSHGQPEVGFAFAELLGFRLPSPGCNASQRNAFTSPKAGSGDRWASLASVTSRTIDWQTIADHYDHMIRYNAAIHTGTADAEAILASVHPQRTPAPDVPGDQRARQSTPHHLPLRRPHLNAAPPRDPRRPQRDRDLELGERFHLLRQGRRHRHQTASTISNSPHSASTSSKPCSSTSTP